MKRQVKTLLVVEMQKRNEKQKAVDVKQQEHQMFKYSPGPN